jgi:hypothetical protein
MPMSTRLIRSGMLVMRRTVIHDTPPLITRQPAGRGDLSMSRLGRLFRSRIALALLGMALVGSGGAYWAVTSSAPPGRQAGNSLTNENPTSSANVEAATTTDPTPPTRPTSTPRPTATPCLTPTPIPSGNPAHWQGRVVSKGTSTFVLRVGCARPTIVVPTDFNNWTGTGIGAVTSFAALLIGANAVVDATSQGGGTYLANSINAHNDT